VTYTYTVYATPFQTKARAHGLYKQNKHFSEEHIREKEIIRIERKRDWKRTQKHKIYINFMHLPGLDY